MGLDISPFVLVQQLA